MQRFARNQGSDSRAGEGARKQLIRREMRFVLQQDVRRFTEQLLARLLDEGCNLNPALARIRFYELFVHRLAAGLPADIQTRFCEKTPHAVIDDSHPRYTVIKKASTKESVMIPHCRRQVQVKFLANICIFKISFDNIFYFLGWDSC